MSFLCYGLVFNFFCKGVHQNSSLIRRWGILAVLQQHKTIFLLLFCIFLVFFQFQISLQHIWQTLCFEQVQWWKQWDGGSRGSLLKEQQRWLSWEMSMQTTGGMLCKDLQALCDACPKCTRLVLEWWCGNEGCPWTQQGSLLHNTVIFTERCLTRWPQLFCVYAVFITRQKWYLYIMFVVWSWNMASKIPKLFVAYTKHAQYIIHHSVCLYLKSKRMRMKWFLNFIFSLGFF